MAIYYKGKKVASNRNVNHKDFVDCRDVEFTNPQEGDVPTWDSTAQKLVNRPAHGIFEVWTNDSPSLSFAGKSIQIEGDYDTFLIEWGRPNAYTNGWTPLDTVINQSALLYNMVMQSNKIAIFQRAVTHTKNNTTNTLAIGDCDKYLYNTYGSNPTQSTDNDWCVPFRIFGVIHND